MNKQIINNYPRKNTDWKYINYLENIIKELKEENKLIKESRREYIRRNTRQSNDLYWAGEEIGQLEHINNKLDKENKQLKEENKILKNKLAYYKQSLL